MTQSTSKEKSVLNDPELFYRATLSAAGYSVDESGAISRPARDNSTTPVEINDKLLYIPTKSLRAKNKWNAVQPFHPLCEDVLCGQSSIIQLLSRNLSVYLTGRILELMSTIVEVGCDNAKQEENNNNPKAYEILTACASEIKVAIVPKWTALLRKLVQKPIVEIYLNRDVECSLDNKVYSRLGIITYNILDMFDAEGVKIGDVHMGSKLNKSVIRSIFEYIVQGIPTEIGSSGIVPYYETYLLILRAFTKRFNELEAPFLRLTGRELIDESWFSVVDDLQPLVGRIPNLPGNSGEPLKNSTNDVEDIVSAWDKVDVPKKVALGEDDIADIKKVIKADTPQPRPNYANDRYVAAPQQTAYDRAPQDRYNEPRDNGPREFSIFDVIGGDSNSRQPNNAYQRETYNAPQRRTPMGDLSNSRRDSRSGYGNSYNSPRGSSPRRMGRAGSYDF